MSAIFNFGIFFFKNWRTLDLSVGQLVPCFGLLVTSALGFKARVDSLLCVLTFLHATDSSFTYGVTPAALLTASMVAEPF